MALFISPDIFHDYFLNMYIEFVCVFFIYQAGILVAKEQAMQLLLGPC